MKYVRLLFAALTCTLLSACASRFEAVKSRSLGNSPRTVHIVAESDDGDAGIKNAVTQELLGRGCKDGFKLGFSDDWKWDIVMYLWTLDLRLVDENTGEVTAAARFWHGGLHTYPNNTQVVKKLFRKLDEVGAFKD
jgi:hypothetical protein